MGSKGRQWTARRLRLARKRPCSQAAFPDSSPAHQRSPGLEQGAAAAWSCGRERAAPRRSPAKVLSAMLEALAAARNTGLSARGNVLWADINDPEEAATPSPPPRGLATASTAVPVDRLMEEEDELSPMAVDPRNHVMDDGPAFAPMAPGAPAPATPSSVHTPGHTPPVVLTPQRRREAIWRYLQTAEAGAAWSPDPDEVLALAMDLADMPQRAAAAGAPACSGDTARPPKLGGRRRGPLPLRSKGMRRELLRRMGRIGSRGGRPPVDFAQGSLTAAAPDSARGPRRGPPSKQRRRAARTATGEEARAGAQSRTRAAASPRSRRSVRRPCPATLCPWPWQRRQRR